MRSLTWLFVCLIPALFAQTAPDVRTGSWRGKAITYQVIDGQPIIEGDIMLGPADALAPADSKENSRAAFSVNYPDFRWPGGTVPYAIVADVPNQQRINDAVRHWNENTPVKLVARTNEADYVRIVRPADATLCSSFAGRMGGEQRINLGDQCDFANAVHEIGHAVGLLHEQSRQDREFYLRVKYENIEKLFWPQYDQELLRTADNGPYDYTSRMHYLLDGSGSRNGQAAMETIPPGIPVGQRSGLSLGDLAAVRQLYGSPQRTVTIATNPGGLRVVIDGQSMTTPQTFDWPVGSTHSLSVETQQTDTVRYRFGRWSNDGEASQRITVSEGTPYYMANFVVQYRFRSSASGGGSVTVQPSSSDGFYTAGTVVSLVANPDPGYEFLIWDGNVYTGPGLGNPQPTFALLNENVIYQALFTRAPVTRIVGSEPGVVVQVDGRSVTLPWAAAWATGSTHKLGVSSTTQVRGNNAYRDVFRNWSVGAGADQTFTAGPEGTTIRAEFQRQFRVVAQSSSENLGTVALNPAMADGYYDRGTTVQATAAPKGNAGLVQWSVDLSGAESAGSVVADDERLIRATFAARNSIANVVNAANYLGSGVAPGEVVTIFGLGLGPAQLSTLQLANGRVATQLDETRVLFDGVPAPLVYVTQNQLSAVVPYGVAGRSRTGVQVQYRGVFSNGVTVPVLAALPGIFTANASGSGPAAALNENGSVNAANNPAGRGSVVVLYATGEGAVDQANLDGKPSAVPLARPTQPVSVTIAGRTARVEYAGAAPGLVAGVLQLNVRVPDDCPTGAVPVQVRVGEQSSPANVSIAVQ